MKLKDKVCIVTGGSSGIGFSICEKFIEEGAILFFTSIDFESAKIAEEKFKSKYSDAKVKGIAPLISDFEVVDKEFSKIYKEYGHIDILVNNAGTSDETPFVDYTEEIFDKVFDLNIKAVFACSRAVINYMKEQKSGNIVNISSVSSVCGQPKGVAYPASKFAVNGFTLSLAREVIKNGIRVNAVAPGIINTAMLKDVPPYMLEPIAKNIPIGRIGEPKDIANAVMFLVSDEASYISGAVLNVDGLVRF